MKKILIFGATGKIGLQTIEIIEKFNEQFDLVGFSFFNNFTVAQKIKVKFPNAKIFSSSKKQFNHVNCYQELIEKTKPDLIVNAIIGFPGLEISFLAIENKINLALANKETIAICGPLFLKKAENIIKIYPIDSEHSALYELLKNQNLKDIKTVLITASGGKYYLEKNLNSIESSYDDVIKHPIWDMGARISIDSSTMINKFFEVIEAYHYFRKPVQVLYHQHALIHAGILKNDCGYHFHFSKPDMKYSINLALNEFENKTRVISEIDFSQLSFNLELIDERKWLPLKWARIFIEKQYLAIPVIVNALDEELIELFRLKKIKFYQIVTTINDYLEKYQKMEIKELKDIEKVDKYMRELLLKDYECN